MKNNNKGMTMVEVLIVIAIMGIASGGVVMSVNLLSSANVGSVAKEIDSELTTMRQQNMTKSSMSYLHIRVKDGKYYKSYDNSVTVADADEYGSKIGSKSVDIYYVIGANETKIDDEFTITFNRNGEVLYYSAGVSVENVDSIKVKKDEKVSTLIITAAGKHFIEE